MVFSAPIFLFAFLPLFLAAYFCVPPRWRNGVGFLGSLFFYTWGEPLFVWWALASAAVDLFVVARLFRAVGAARKRWLITGIGANLALLIWFKYANFASGNLSDLLFWAGGIHLPQAPPIALPIGVSFIVFEKITYVADVYRGVGKPAGRVLDYLFYVFLFPKLLAGPIIKYHDIADQLRQRAISLDDVSAGLTRFVFGLAAKVFIADTMGELANLVFAPNYLSMEWETAWIGVIAYSIQIFFDFSGYSHMALGLARVMGFHLPENFNRPYTAIGFADFWRRWHISLSSFIRDYLYVALGGNRVPVWRTYVNLWICFLLSGLWHGAAWNFILWGAYHGFFLTLDRMFMHKWLQSLPRILAVLITFLLVIMGWVVFRAPDMATAIMVYKSLISPATAQSRFVVMGAQHIFFMALGLILIFLPLLPPFPAVEGWVRRSGATPAVALLAALPLCLVSVAKVMALDFNPFLYFRF